MAWARLAALGLMAAAASACVSGPRNGPRRGVTPETAQECVDACNAMGLRMQSVVLVAGHSGCVCEPGDAPRSDARSGAGAAVNAMVALQEDAERAAIEDQVIQEQQMFWLLDHP
jgi:hypothetical protein